MKERGILFSGEMVRAILEGRKTQTRRVCKLNASGRVELHGRNWHVNDKGDAIMACPYGFIGDRLWIRETFRIDHGIPTFRASCLTTFQKYHKWKPSIFMPRWASRITLEIVSVRVERLQEISRGDSMAEGCPFPNMAQGDDPRKWYADLWDSINGKKYPWSSNPFVWVIEFKRLPA